MLELAQSALQVAEILAEKSTRTTLNEFETQLYEASSRFATTVLRFKDVCSQSAILKAEQELHELQQGKAC